MGWLFMRSMDGHTTPRDYLDAQFTRRSDEHGTRRILRSALVKMRTYYAAYEIVVPNHPREVVALVCLVKYNKRARDGYIFGYKDLDETAGPCEAECPAAILDLLTPTTHESAIGWRQRCRAFATQQAASPKLRNGDVIVFDHPMRFTDGTTHGRFITVIDPAKPRTISFRPTAGGGRYRISRLKTRSFKVEPNETTENQPR